MSQTGLQFKAAPAMTQQPQVVINRTAEREIINPPVLILGGEANALSVIRDLHACGVKVYAVGEADNFIRHSRYCEWIDLPGSDSVEEVWADFLLSDASEFLTGALVLACSDAGVRVLIRHQAELREKFLLDECNPAAQLTMLDKLATYKCARAAGVDTPLFWEISGREDAEALRDQLVFPLLIKPRLSHVFEARFGRKHITVNSFVELMTSLGALAGEKANVLLMELIPGGDDQLCSYFTYLDEQSRPLFHFTKRVIRRYPTGMGGACYHRTDWIPQIVEPATRLFAHAGLRGLGNVEFKQDPRDGKFKLIECNARFNGSNALVSESGCRLAQFVYRRATGGALPEMDHFRYGLRQWDPMRDFFAFIERRRSGQLTLRQWLRSVMHWQTFAYFQWSDPLPALSRLLRPLKRRLGGRHGGSTGKG